VPRKGERAAVMASRRQTSGGCGATNGWYWCLTKRKAAAVSNGQNKTGAGAGVDLSSSNNRVGRGEEHPGNCIQTRKP